MSDYLREIHFGAGILHAVQSLAVGFLLANKDDTNEFGLEQRVYGEQSWRVTSNHIQWLVPAFPALSSVNHLEAALNYDNYMRRLETTNTNWVRWSEYSVSAGVMLFIIAQLSGIENISLLTLIVLANVALQFCGYMIEKTNDQDLGFTVIGYMLFVAIWVPIVWNFFEALDKASGETDEEGNRISIPDLVYAIIFVEISLFATFGIVSSIFRSKINTKQRKQQKQQKHQQHQRYKKTNKSRISIIEDIKQREIWFAALSLISKSFLTWTVFGGALNAGRNK